MKVWELIKGLELFTAGDEVKVVVGSRIYKITEASDQGEEIFLFVDKGVKV